MLITACTRNGNDDVPALADTGSDNASLYDQGQTASCWIYAMCVCIEQEQMLKGDSVALSRHWLLSHAMQEQTLRLYMKMKDGGDVASPTADPREGFSIRGVGPEALRLISIYGLVPYSHERSYIASGSVLTRKLTMLAKTATSLQSLHDSMYECMPHFTISRPVATTKEGVPTDESLFADVNSGFYYLSMRYTPLQFAESIMYDQNWQFYSSVNYHKWGERIALEVPDNQNGHEYTNLPMDSLLHKTVRSLRKGHPVYWEYGKKKNPAAGGVNSDHAMAIIGITKSKDGHPRFLCRNSYGKGWGKNGTCLVSADFFMHHTCCIGVVNE